MIHDFWLSFAMVFLAEMGDKTQLVSLTLATRYNVRVVLAGIFCATLLVHVFSAALGCLAGELLPADWIRFVAGLAFIAFGFWTLRGDTLDEENGRERRFTSPFLVVCVVFFLAELGDKTMLCTVTLATSGLFIPVWIGSTLGMVLADGLAIWVGKFLGTRLPERVVKVIAATIFFGFGIYGAVRGGINLPPIAWGLGGLSVVLLLFLFVADLRSRNLARSAP